MIFYDNNRQIAEQITRDLGEQNSLVYNLYDVRTDRI